MSKSGSYSASDTLDKVKTIHIQSMYSVMLVYFCCCNQYVQAYCESMGVTQRVEPVELQPVCAGILRVINSSIHCSVTKVVTSMCRHTARHLSPLIHVHEGVATSMCRPLRVTPFTHGVRCRAVATSMCRHTAIIL